MLGGMDIDVRGPRFGAAVTTVVLAAVLVTGSGVLLAWQALCFAVGAVAGVQRSPYGWVFRTAVRPRIGPPAEFESPDPPRFAQGVGLAFALIGLTGYFWGPLWLAMAATGCALAAAFLNAVFGYCLGCELYLLFRRATTARQ
jgi:FtsH-binding integral membrane protein